MYNTTTDAHNLCDCQRFWCLFRLAVDPTTLQDVSNLISVRKQFAQFDLMETTHVSEANS